MVWDLSVILRGMMTLDALTIVIVLVMTLFLLRRISPWGQRSYDREIELRRKAESEAAHYRALFEEAVQRHTAEISQAMQEGISRSIAEKELLLKELHHRVKNNLQIICSLLRLQAGYVPEGPARGLFRNSEERVKCMALVHERLYRSESLTSVGFNGYAAELIRQLLRSYGVDPSQARLTVELEPVELTIDKAVPAGLILNELFTNALKYGKSSEEKLDLRVSLKRNGDFITMLVADQGSGLRHDIDPSNPNTLGLRVVQTLCKQLNATLSLDRNGGSVFSIRFPAEKAEPGQEHTLAISKAVA